MYSALWLDYIVVIFLYCQHAISDEPYNDPAGNACFKQTINTQKSLHTNTNTGDTKFPNRLTLPVQVEGKQWLRHQFLCHHIVEHWDHTIN